MSVYMTARWKANPEAAGKVEDALREFVAAVKENEPHTHQYTALKSEAGEATYMTYFIFEDEAARDFHGATDWVRRFTSVIYPENLGDIEFTSYELIASTDR